MDIRLVAYRPATSSDTVETTYELDLTKAPNISLKYQFSELKNPETRKGSFSKTFRLPFTKKNHAFFQNWYNVNLEKLVFSTKEKFNASLYIKDIPQMEGYLQLKAIYQKAKEYEVVLMSNTADLFSAIGEKKLKDVFLNTDGSYSNELNHLYTKQNILDSWDGSSSDFTSDCATCSGESLRDTVAGVQKVMYPLTATRPNFWYSEENKEYLNLDDDEIDDFITEWGEYQGRILAYSFSANIEQLRPAIQIKELFNLICAKAGFTYRSTFIDGEYFGKIFMTLGGHLESELLPTKYPDTQIYPTGSLYARSVSSDMPAWSNADNIEYPFLQNFIEAVNCNTDDVEIPTPITFSADSEVNDESEVWNEGYMFTKISPNMFSVTIEGKYKAYNALPVCGYVYGEDNDINVEFYLYDAITGDIMNDSLQSIAFGVSEFGNEEGYWSCTFDISDLALGTQFSIGIQPPAMKSFDLDYPYYNADFELFRNMGSGIYSKINASWLPYGDTQYDKEILIPSCIDPEITQAEFLQDIIQRFNLIVSTDPNDSSNISIEPYDLFISAGGVKHWTDKLDKSKEIIVKDTTALQKKLVHLSDEEDDDLMNKSVRETAPTLNVYGKYEQENLTNQFAVGSLKNKPLFAPYINQQIFRIGSETATDLSNVAVQYEISYAVDDEGTVESEMTATKPKLFYYCGATTDIKKADGTSQTIYLHQITPSTGDINARSFTTYPLCSPWDIKTNEAAPTYEYTLTSENRSLYWDFAPPQCGNLRVFNYEYNLELVYGSNTLYSKYWSSYLDSLYSEESRILIAYFNLSEVDIFQFQFSDQIFIKDSFWRIQTIENYQVGAKASTKITLLKKMDDAVALPQGCNSVVSSVEIGGWYSWCPSNNAGCTPDLATTGLYVSEACCEGAGGAPLTIAATYADQGLYPCMANTGSLPMRLKSHLSNSSLFNQGQFKNLMAGKLGGLNNPFTVGTNSGKSKSTLILPQGDDMVIKYKNQLKTGPAILGESHRMVLTGYTEGTTTGYAYPRGNNVATSNKIFLPQNSNVMISIKGMSTVVGGTDSTYVVGTTESFSYHTAFVVQGGTINQIGNTGGVQDWSLKEASLSTTSTLEIITNETGGEVQFGLKDSEATTKKSWSLIVDFNVQSLGNLQLPFGENWAIWQAGGPIGLQNFERLIWN
tara:strand:- start:2002 stop:5523 length:3522 start_codon:yes stop_codon:yes gene_type:complete